MIYLKLENFVDLNAVKKKEMFKLKRKLVA